MVEEWRDVVGYEGLYQVSNLGRVKSLEKVVSNGRGWRLIKEKIRKPCRAGKHRQYLCVALHKERVGQQLYVHRLVATAFLENPEDKPCVDHIDCNPENNCVTNLRWVTFEENSHNPETYRKTYKNGALMKARGHSEEQKKRWSIQRKGKIPKNCTSKKPVRNADTGEVFESAKAAGVSINRKGSVVTSAIRRKGTSGGYRWEYVGG
ncbi:NUMOD4 domain-containing protein [Turicimonas muris]|uniref:NUMOD4 domain-containing protein n=1 Tax=Turicimonas muris TaxID=1796652 RepID=UPI0023F0B75C|nr:NUMOD4 domain-containing protein [Turicimonas muris]